MATVKKSKKKVIVPICIILVIAIVAGTVFGVVKSKSGEEVKLNTIATGDIYEKVSLTGDVTAGTSKEYKVGAVALRLKMLMLRLAIKLKRVMFLQHLIPLLLTVRFLPFKLLITTQ